MPSVLVRRGPVSIIDTDLYKLTMQQAALELYPHAVATYQFIDRRLDKLGWLAPILRMQIEEYMTKLSLSDVEAKWLATACPFLKPGYIEYLRNYRFDPSELSTITSDDNGDLKITIRGPWHRTILWEVPLMALISECYFTAPRNRDKCNRTDQVKKAVHKCSVLKGGHCKFADFGTRRRHDYDAQDVVVGEFRRSGYNGFVGTSNVQLAWKHDTKPIGTMAHEWIQAHAILSGLRHANRYALEAWGKVYNGALGVALTDTFGSNAFFDDFVGALAHTFDGVRHDSADPFEFTGKVVRHYESLRIPPPTKTIVFSDSLNVEKAVAIQQHCDNLHIGCSFGIGTHFTNDFDGPLKPLNMVIKLLALNGHPVVKLSDDRGKEIGDPDALRVAKWTFLNEPLG